MTHPSFSDSEYQTRVRALQAKMKEEDLAGVVITTEPNYNYFAGYHHFAPWTTFCRPTFCLIPNEGEPVLLVHKFLVADASRDSWFTQVEGYESLTFAPVPQVIQLAKDLGLYGGTIGMELGPETRLGLTIHEYESLREALSPSPVVDASHLIWDLRIVKSEAEKACLREAARIAHRAYTRCFEEIRPGMTEVEVRSILASEIVSCGGDVGFVIMTSGEGDFERVSGLPREKKIEKGDFVWIDLGVVYRGYWSDHSRAVVLGKALPEQKEMWKLASELTWLAMEKCRPSIKPSELIDVLEAERKKLGLEFSFAAGRSGHGFGLMSTEPPHIATYDDTELRAGTAFTMEPGWVDSRLGCFVVEENLILTESGCEVLTKTRRDLVEV